MSIICYIQVVILDREVFVYVQMLQFLVLFWFFWIRISLVLLSDVNNGFLRVFNVGLFLGVIFGFVGMEGE